MSDLAAFADSPWSIVVFVIASLAVTRVLDAGLKEKIPKWLLPYISMVVGLSGQMVLGLAAGLSWKQAMLFGFASGAGGAWTYSAGAKRVPGVRATRRDRGSIRTALLCFMAAGCLLCYLLALNGCFTVPDWCAKGQLALKDEVSPRVEPPLKAKCVEEATKCANKGIAAHECSPVHRCQDWVRKYAAGAKAVHRGLAIINEVWQDLEKEGTVKP